MSGALTAPLSATCQTLLGFAGLNFRPFADHNLRVVNMRQHVVEVAHVEPFPATWAFHEMIGLGCGDAASVRTKGFPK
jgi:hypothetical protein